MVLALIAILCCTKQQQQQPIVYRYISWKHTIDTALLRIDTLWTGYNLTAHDIAVIKLQLVQWYLFCTPPIVSMPTFVLEKDFYKF